MHEHTHTHTHIHTHTHTHIHTHTHTHTHISMHTVLAVDYTGVFIFKCPDEQVSLYTCLHTINTVPPSALSI